MSEVVISVSRIEKTETGDLYVGSRIYRLDLEHGYEDEFAAHLETLPGVVLVERLGAVA
jgi:hypothetical protein